MSRDEIKTRLLPTEGYIQKLQETIQHLKAAQLKEIDLSDSPSGNTPTDREVSLVRMALLSEAKVIIHQSTNPVERFTATNRNKTAVEMGKPVIPTGAFLHGLSIDNLVYIPNGVLSGDYFRKQLSDRPFKLFLSEITSSLVGDESLQRIISSSRSAGFGSESNQIALIFSPDSSFKKRLSPPIAGTAKNWLARVATVGVPAVDITGCIVPKESDEEIVKKILKQFPFFVPGFKGSSTNQNMKLFFDHRDYIS